MAAVFIYFIIDSRLFDIGDADFGLDLTLAALSVQLFIVCSFVLLAIRYVLLIGPPKVCLNISLRSIILSLGLNLVLPGRLSELLKATYLRDHAAVPLSRGFSAIVLERLVDLMIVAVLGLIAVVNYFDQGSYSFMPVFGVMVAVVVMVALRFQHLVLRVIGTLPSARLAGFLERAYRHFSATARTQVFWQALLIGGLAWGMSCGSFLVFINLAGSIPVGLSGALLVFVMTTLGGAIPALPGGLGTYEAAAVVALRSLGYGFDEALVLALAMHASQLILPFILAIVIMMTERVGISSLIADLRRSAPATTGSGSGNEKGERGQ